MTIQELAAEARKKFIRKTRDNGQKYYCIDTLDDTNAWITEMCHKAHGDMLPDDWRYKFIVESLDAIDEEETDLRDCCELEEDIYTADLTAWLSSRNDRIDYCESACDEYGMSAEDGLLYRIQLGQRREKNEVLESVRESLTKRLESLEKEAS